MKQHDNDIHVRTALASPLAQKDTPKALRFNFHASYNTHAHVIQPLLYLN